MERILLAFVAGLAVAEVWERARETWRLVSRDLRERRLWADGERQRLAARDAANAGAARVSLSWACRWCGATGIGPLPDEHLHIGLGGNAPIKRPEHPPLRETLADADRDFHDELMARLAKNDCPDFGGDAWGQTDTEKAPTPADHPWFCWCGASGKGAIDGHFTEACVHSPRAIGKALAARMNAKETPDAH